MDRSETINLISSSWIKDKNGVNRKIETSRTVYCNVSSVSQSEFFQAGQMGLKPEYRFTMFFYDYLNEEIIEYNGTRYTVYRTFHSSNDLIELYTNKVAGNVNGSNFSG